MSKEAENILPEPSMHQPASSSMTIDHAALKRESIRKPFAEFNETLLAAVLDGEAKLKENLEQARAEQLELAKQFTKADGERQISAMQAKRIKSERSVLERERRRLDIERQNMNSVRDSVKNLKTKLVAIKEARGLETA